MDVLLIIIILALIGTGISLALGLLAMSGGGENDRKFSTPFMWTRIGFHALTMVLLIVAAMLR